MKNAESTFSLIWSRTQKFDKIYFILYKTNNFLKDYNRKAILYSIFVTFVCIMHFIAVIQMIKEITENENEGNKVKK